MNSPPNIDTTLIDKINRGKSNILIEAVLKNDLDLIKTLIKNGSSVHIEDKNGNSLLHLSSNNNHISIARFLLKNGSNPNHRNLFKETPIFSAIKKEHTEMVKLLLDNNANLFEITDLITVENSKDKFYVENDHYYENKRNYHGKKWVETPLSVAVKQNNYEIVKILIEKAEADELKDNPTYHSTRNYREHPLEIIEHYNSLENKYDETLLHIAIFINRFTPVCKIFGTFCWVLIRWARTPVVGSFLEEHCEFIVKNIIIIIFDNELC